ncbi:MAG: hypothetical protein CV045_14150, partial [Cyanobacteria bacterium M5B4]
MHAQNSLPSGSACLKPLLRYWNKDKQRHFYTVDRNELGTGQNGWVYEGFVGYVAATSSCYAPNAVPFYRYWSALKQKHFYSTNPEEAIVAKAHYEFVFEGITGYILSGHAAQYQTTALYRLYKNEDHFYTSSAIERDAAVSSSGYVSEGTAGYVFTALEPTPTPVPPTPTR